MELRKIKVGNWIKFRSPTRAGTFTVTRKVNGFSNGYPTVRYIGWCNFSVKPREILEVYSEKPEK